MSPLDDPSNQKRVHSCGECQGISCLFGMGLLETFDGCFSLWSESDVETPGGASGKPYIAFGPPYGSSRSSWGVLCGLDRHGWWFTSWVAVKSMCGFGEGSAGSSSRPFGEEAGIERHTHGIKRNGGSLLLLVRVSSLGTRVVETVSVLLLRCVSSRPLESVG